MGAAEMKAGHEEEYVDGTSAAPWPQLDGVRPNTSPALVDDGRRSEENGEGRGGAKYNTSTEQCKRVPCNNTTDESFIFQQSLLNECFVLFCSPQMNFTNCLDHSFWQYLLSVHCHQIITTIKEGIP